MCGACFPHAGSVGAEVAQYPGEVAIQGTGAVVRRGHIELNADLGPGMRLGLFAVVLLSTESEMRLIESTWSLSSGCQTLGL